MEDEREVVLAGSGTTSETSTKQQHDQQTPLKILKVMVALDDSDASFYALNWALNNLLSQRSSFGPISSSSSSSGGGDDDHNGGGCMVYVVHVQPSFQNYVYPVGPGLHTAAFATSSVVESVRKAQAEISATILERALSFCTHTKVRAETLVLEGDPKEEICKAIEQTHVDMLVIGSRGLGQIKRAFLGSVSDYCAHHASCPVLIVKPPKVMLLS